MKTHELGNWETWVRHYNRYATLVHQIHHELVWVLILLAIGGVLVAFGALVIAAMIENEGRNESERLGRISHGTFLTILSIGIMLLGTSGSLFGYRHLVQLPKCERLYQQLEKEVMHVHPIESEVSVYVNEQRGECGNTICNTPKYPVIVLYKGHRHLVLTETNDRHVQVRTMKRVNIEQLTDQVVKDQPKGGVTLSKRYCNEYWVRKHLQRLPQHLND